MPKNSPLLRVLRQLLAVDRPQRSIHLYDKVDMDVLRHTWTR